jgi:hypothetical protein
MVQTIPYFARMISARRVALLVNGTQVTKATLRHGENELELVIADPLLGEIVISESFTLELRNLFIPTRSEVDCQIAVGGGSRFEY